MIGFRNTGFRCGSLARKLIPVMRCLAVSLVLARALHAQAPSSVQNVRDLTSGLLVFMNIDTAIIRYSQAADGFPLTLLSRGATVVGFSDDGSGQPSTFVLFPSDFRGAVDSLRHRLVVSGWRPIEVPVPARGSTPPQGGRGNASPLPTYRCSNGDSLQALWMRSVASTTMLRLQHFRSASGQPCNSSTDISPASRSTGVSEAVEAEFLNSVVSDLGFDSPRVRPGGGDSAVAWVTGATQMRPLGFATFSFGTVTVAVSEQDPARIIASIAERARTEGFEGIVRPAGVSREMGFEQPPYRPEAAAEFCKPPHVASVNSYAQQPSGSIVTIMYVRAEGYVACRTVSATPQQPNDVPAAVLKSPGFASHKVTRRSSSRIDGKVNRSEVTATIRRTVSLDSIFAHYSEQLQAQGWTIADSARTSTTISRQFRVTHTDGVQWSADLTLTPLNAPSTLIELRFSMRR